MIQLMLIVITVLCVIFAATVAHGSDNRRLIKTLFVFLCLCMGVWSLAIAFFLGSEDASTRLLAAQVFYLVAAIFPPVFFVFSLLFPKPSNVDIVSIAIVSVGATAMSLLWVFLPGHGIVIDSVRTDGQVVASIDHARYLVFAAGFVLFFFAGIVVTIAKAIAYTGRLRYQSVAYLLGVLLMSIPGFYANLWLPFWGEYSSVWVGPAAVVIFLAFMTYSVVRHGLFDVRLVAVRTLVYSLSVFVMAMAYFGLAYLASVTVFRDSATSGVGMSPLNVGIALVLALIFQPVKQFFDRVTSHIFYRDQYDANEFISRLGRMLTETTLLHDVLERSGDEIASMLKASGYMFLVYRESHDDVVVGSRLKNHLTIEERASLKELVDFVGEHVFVVGNAHRYHDQRVRHIRSLLAKRRVALVLPLVTSTETVGYLLLGEHKANGYMKRDFRVLETIADELVIAIQNARSVQEVRDLNENLERRVELATKELRASNKQLIEMDATKDEFVSMASHQLRTPLTSVKGYISMVLDGDVGEISPSQRQLLEEAFTSSERMVHLIGDFLNVSRLQTGKFVIDPHACDLAKVVSQEVDGMQQIAAAHGLKIVYKRPARFPTLYVDEGKIRQVIMNFMDNAVYYSPDTASITVSLAIEDGDAVLRVTDKGMGVPKDEQKKLFGKFFRAGNARTQRPDGTGIGLYLAKKVIDGHGGKPVFESTLGKGSTFGFRLPVKKLSKPPVVKDEE
ncbi:MAG: ATP-binding protein [Candidatus Saccharimonas sp.]